MIGLVNKTDQSVCASGEKKYYTLRIADKVFFM